MTNQFAKATALVATLLLGTASISYAQTVTTGNGGISAGTNGAAGGNNGTATIGQGAGPLVTFDTDGTRNQNSSQSDADVNLGSLLAGLPDGIDVGDIGDIDVGGAGGTGSASFRAIVNNMSANDRKALKLRCRDVLASPKTHKSDVVSFCKMIAQL